ncbi:MAG TPA: 4'-phosphopantetheinyl transferase superfamily protein [Chthoniobacterales bacterium]
MQLRFLEWTDSDSSRQIATSLGNNDVQVWSAPVNRGEINQFAGRLSPGEQLRANQFIANDARDHFIVSRVVLRDLLGACLHIEPAAVSFGTSPRGKPFLNSAIDNDLSFNLSHSGGLVLIALTRGRDIGVDVERADRPVDWLQLAPRIFSARQLREIAALPAAIQQRAFFNGWTRKEAYLKATGEGLIEDLQAIEVTVEPDVRPRLLQLPTGPDSVGKWELVAVPLPSEYAGAIVFEE